MTAKTQKQISQQTLQAILDDAISQDVPAPINPTESLAAVGTLSGALEQCGFQANAFHRDLISTDRISNHMISRTSVWVVLVNGLLICPEHQVVVESWSDIENMPALLDLKKSANTAWDDQAFALMLHPNRYHHPKPIARVVEIIEFHLAAQNAKEITQSLNSGASGPAPGKKM